MPQRSSGARNQAAELLWVVLVFSLTVLVLVFGTLFWFAGELSGVLTGHGWPDSSPADVVAILIGLVRHGGSPVQAWPAGAAAALGPGWLVYLIFALFLVPVPFGGFLLVRLLLNWRRRREFRVFRLGFASGREIRQMLSAKTVAGKARSVRPSLRDTKGIDPLDVGFYLGRDIRSKQPLYGSVEDVFVILAPPRQGKDVHFCAPYTIDAPGPCIVTSTRADAFSNTYAMRAKVGAIYVFDPSGLTNWPQRLRWSPVSGCQEPRIATARSAAIVNGGGVELQGDLVYWVSRAITILRCYLHAAAVGGKTMADVLRWSLAPTGPEPVIILRQGEVAGTATPGWAAALEACMGADPKSRGAMWAVLSQALSCFADPAVVDACSPGPDEVFDLRAFLAGRNTLYVLGKEQKNASVAPIVTAMMEALFDEARIIASRMPGSRLDPPLTVELNEAAHIAPMPNLPAYMGDSGGFSIALHVYLQSFSQARARWGEHEAMIMWDNAAVRVIMGGAGNIDDLDDISRLMGETRHHKYHENRRVLSAEEIRTLKFGRAVIVARAARPVEAELTPWWKRRDGAEIAAGKAHTEALIVRYSEEAERAARWTNVGGAPALPPGPAGSTVPALPRAEPVRQIAQFRPDPWWEAGQDTATPWDHQIGDEEYRPPTR